MSKHRNSPYSGDLPNSVYNSLFYESAQLETTNESTLGSLIVEVSQEDGLDSLGLYPDGSIKYINHSEALSILGSPNELSDKALKILKGIDWEKWAVRSPASYEKSGYPINGDAQITKLYRGKSWSVRGKLTELTSKPETASILLGCGLLLHAIAAVISKNNNQD